jgi:hypothetical protein
MSVEERRHRCKEFQSRFGAWLAALFARVRSTNSLCRLPQVTGPLPSLRRARPLIAPASELIQANGLRARKRSFLYLDRARYGAGQIVVTMVSGVNKQLGLLQQLNSAVGVHHLSVAYKLLRLEQVLGKFPAGVFVPEQLGVIKAAGEFGKDLVFVFRDIGVLRFDQPLRRAHH